MKVIGTTQGRYLVEMDAEELELLRGSTSYRCEIDQRKIGQQFKIRESWRTIGSLQSHQEELPKTANKLRALADLLEPIAVEIPLVNP